MDHNSTSSSAFVHLKAVELMSWWSAELSADSRWCVYVSQPGVWALRPWRRFTSTNQQLEQLSLALGRKFVVMKAWIFFESARRWRDVLINAFQMTIDSSSGVKLCFLVVVFFTGGLWRRYEGSGRHWPWCFSPAVRWCGLWTHSHTHSHTLCSNYCI